jgi:hypothetical protein
MASRHRRALPTLSSRLPRAKSRGAKRGICFFLLALSFSLAVSAQNPPRRLRILGIASVGIISDHLLDSKDFYSKILTLDHPCLRCGHRPIHSFSVNPIQYIQPDTHLPDEITFEADDVVNPAPEMSDDPQRRQLITAYGPSHELSPGVYFSVFDPEGHGIAFVRIPAEAHRPESNRSSTRLVQAGFLVNHRAEENHFHKDTLGFRPNPDSVAKGAGNELADLLVPDGTDAIQCLLGVPPGAAKLPPNAVYQIVVGVTDVAQLKYANGKRGLQLGEPEIGRDCKWQLNLYGPDSTRIELMEFAPVQVPCCNPYTRPHPKP